MAMSDTTRPEDGEREDPLDDGDGAAEEAPSGAEDPAFAEERARQDAADFQGEGELELGDDDTRLPWLEGAEDDVDEGAYNTGQLVAFVLLGLVALALIVGGIWWLTHRGGEEELVADGSVIEAPEGDYKERPEDPGGKTFEGTGDSSFAVSEGETRPARLGEGGEAARPGFEAVDTGKTGEAAQGASDSESASATSSGPGVQVGAYSTRSAAESGWNTISQRNSALNGMRYRIVEGKADIGTVYRLQALPGDAAAARALCSKLKAAGQDCSVKN